MDPNIWDVSHHFERVCVRELHATVGTVVPAGFTTCTGVHAQARTAGTALDEAYAPSACWVNRNGGAPRRANAALPTEGTSDVLVRQRHVTRNDACRLATTRPAGSETVANLSVIASTRTIQASKRRVTYTCYMDVASRIAMAAAAGVAAAAIWRAYCRRKIETPAVDCTEPPAAAQCRPLNEPYIVSTSRSCTRLKASVQMLRAPSPVYEAVVHSCLR